MTGTKKSKRAQENLSRFDTHISPSQSEENKFTEQRWKTHEVRSYRKTLKISWADEATNEEQKSKEKFVTYLIEKE